MSTSQITAHCVYVWQSSANYVAEVVEDIVAGGKAVSAVVRTSPLRSPEMNNLFIADWLIILEPALWIPVSRALPPGADYYLVAWTFEGRELTGEAWYDVHNEWTFPVYADDKYVESEIPNVTHWAPMPGAPELMCE